MATETSPLLPRRSREGESQELSVQVANQEGNVQVANQEGHVQVANQEGHVKTQSKLCRTALVLVLIILPVAFSGIRAVTFIVAIATTPTNKTCELNETVMDYRCTPHRWSCKASGGYDLSIDAAYAIGKLLHVIEFFVFGFCAYKFCTEKEACKNARSDVREVFRKACGKASKLFWCFVVLVVVPYGIIGVPVLLYFEVVPEYRDAGCGKGLLPYHVVLIIHDWMGVAVHSYSVAQRIVMVVACLAVYQVWHPQSNEPEPTVDRMVACLAVYQMWHPQQEPREQPHEELDSLLENIPEDQSLTAILRGLYLQSHQMDARLAAPMQRYTEKGNRIVPILKIFQVWFIIQWFAFLATTLADLINVLKPLTVPINDFIEQQVEWYLYIFFHFLYGLLSFIIPFLCGSLMNKLHNDYYRNLRKKVRRRLLGLLVSMEKEEDFDFTPGIHEIGLDIPISNQGYSMSIVLALIALVSTLVVSNPDYWSFE